MKILHPQLPPKKWTKKSDKTLLDTNKETINVEKKLFSVDVSENKEILKEEIKKTDIPPPAPPNSPTDAKVQTES